ncbi:Uu.00g125760.m01.CDS01 [Anthostomella pinea]|uniref:Uu.00g125760.m01.CDS01 n=1 Tax=Anthostomella pinea TaxID=933095 RepID=A0AAI8VCJ1_9PEZI|nr:Uu.00g125760.m01.CDS01 [Anthostomella pinea]
MAEPIIFYDIASGPPKRSYAPNPWKTRFALNFKRVHYRTHWVELPDVERTRRSLNCAPVRWHADEQPFYTLPVIVEPATGRTIGDSFDIAVYLDEQYPADNSSRRPQLIAPGTAGLVSAFNKYVDAIFTNACMILDRHPWDPATAEQTKAEFVRRLGVDSWEDLMVGEEDRPKVLAAFRVSLGGLAAHYRREKGLWIDGGEMPAYADMIVAAWWQMYRKCSREEEYEEMMGWHDGLWEELMEGLEPVDLFDRFKKHSGLSKRHVKLFQEVVVKYDYISRDDCESEDWDDVEPAKKLYRTDGSEHTLTDVNVTDVANAIEDHIDVYVATNRRTEVYHKVFDGFPGQKKIPKWDRSVDSPRSHPQTPFSAPRLAGLSLAVMSEEPFKRFVSASQLKLKDLDRIHNMIIWRDSASSNGCWGAIAWDDFEVQGGRLGPDHKHTLRDVPICYLRDRLMAAINTEVVADKREHVRNAVFSDLSASEVEAYAAVIGQGEEENVDETKSRAKKKSKARKIPSADDPERQAKAQQIREDRKINLQEAESILKQQELIDAIDDTIDLAPNPAFAARNMTSDFGWGETIETIHPSRRSVKTPGNQVESDDELPLKAAWTIDRDCDQVRAVIKVFVTRCQWTIDQLLAALYGVWRPQLNKFLGQRGPLQGKESFAFRRSWEFFKQREVLGLELGGPLPKPLKLAREVKQLRELRGVDTNRGHKRSSLEGSDRPLKAQKTSRR